MSVIVALGMGGALGVGLSALGLRLIFGLMARKQQP